MTKPILGMLAGAGSGLLDGLDKKMGGSEAATPRTVTVDVCRTKRPMRAERMPQP
jgi:hypothetical protein